MRATAAALLLLAAPAALALDQDRPGEGEIFGSPSEPPPETAEPGGRPPAEKRLLEALLRTDDPLKIGGLFFLRTALTATESGPPSSWPFAVPNLLDLYLDARPSDRVRGFVLARMFYDPTLPRSGVVYRYQSFAPQISTSTGQGNPRAILDQLWLRFDVDRAVFLTAGRQHVKWGVGRFWNPTDYLHVARRDPLATFDDRAGTSMLKVHLPWEARGWNLYAFAIAEPLVPPPMLPGLVPPPPPPGQLGAVGGALRAEVVLGSWEIGVGGVAQRGMVPRAALDFSTGFWEVDLRGELSLKRGSDLPRLENRGTDDAPVYALQTVSGIRTAAVAGLEWQHKYSDEDNFTLGLEYFWNQDGYDDPHLYLPVLAAQLATPFYLGQHYAGAYLRLPQPGSWNLHTFTLSVLANLSDRSAVARLDWSMTFLTYLTLEAFLAGHTGVRGGEFRFGFETAPRAVALPPPLYPVCVGLGGSLSGGGSPCNLPPMSQPAPVIDAGVGLRLPL